MRAFGGFNRVRLRSRRGGSISKVEVHKAFLGEQKARLKGEEYLREQNRRLAEAARDKSALAAALAEARKPWLRKVGERVASAARRLFRRDV